MNALKVLAIAVYTTYERNYDATYNLFSYGCVWQGSKVLEDMYHFLAELDYKISEEELKMINGTHELYVEGKKNDVD